MSNVALKGLTSGKFFVQGSGFIACTIKTATPYTANAAVDMQNCLRNAGVESSTTVAIPATKSFAVFYVRPQDLNADNSVKQNALSPSKWRFATRAEANTHGKRFDERVKRASKVGMGHVGFFVAETNDPVNASINPATGKTNPVG